MNDDQFTKLFKEMQKGFSEINQHFDIQDRKIEELTGAIAELGGQLRDYLKK
jgi:hypothetical protein